MIIINYVQNEKYRAEEINSCIYKTCSHLRQILFFGLDIHCNCNCEQSLYHVTSLSTPQFLVILIQEAVFIFCLFYNLFLTLNNQPGWEFIKEKKKTRMRPRKHARKHANTHENTHSYKRVSTQARTITRTKTRKHARKHALVQESVHAKKDSPKKKQ